MKRQHKWCFECNTRYYGVFNTCCNACYKWKKGENRVCKRCQNPDCKSPEFYPHGINRRKKVKDHYPLDPSWDFRGLTVDDMEETLPSDMENYE